jgi:hypothetical protein
MFNLYVPYNIIGYILFNRNEFNDITEKEKEVKKKVGNY